MLAWLLAGIAHAQVGILPLFSNTTLPFTPQMMSKSQRLAVNIHEAPFPPVWQVMRGEQVDQATEATPSEWFSMTMGDARLVRYNGYEETWPPSRNSAGFSKAIGAEGPTSHFSFGIGVGGEPGDANLPVLSAADLSMTMMHQKVGSKPVGANPFFIQTPAGKTPADTTEYITSACPNFLPEHCTTGLCMADADSAAGGDCPVLPLNKDEFKYSLLGMVYGKEINSAAPGGMCENTYVCGDCVGAHCPTWNGDLGCPMDKVCNFAHGNFVNPDDATCCTESRCSNQGVDCTPTPGCTGPECLNGALKMDDPECTGAGCPRDLCCAVKGAKTCPMGSTLTGPTDGEICTQVVGYSNGEGACPEGSLPATWSQCENLAAPHNYMGALSADANWIDGCFQWYQNSGDAVGSSAKVYYNDRPGATTGGLGGHRICVGLPLDPPTPGAMHTGIPMLKHQQRPQKPHHEKDLAEFETLVITQILDLHSMGEGYEAYVGSNSTVTIPLRMLYDDESKLALASGPAEPSAEPEAMTTASPTQGAMKKEEKPSVMDEYAAIGEIEEEFPELKHRPDLAREMLFRRMQRAENLTAAEWLTKTPLAEIPEGSSMDVTGNELIIKGPTGPISLTFNEFFTAGTFTRENYATAKAAGTGGRPSHMIGRIVTRTLRASSAVKFGAPKASCAYCAPPSSAFKQEASAGQASAPSKPDTSLQVPAAFAVA
jgi:hypothetical protein